MSCDTCGGDSSGEFLDSDDELAREHPEDVCRACCLLCLEDHFKRYHMDEYITYLHEHYCMPFRREE